MASVWVVDGEDPDGFAWSEAVFSTQDRAERYIAALKAHRVNSYGTRDKFWVNEFIVDEIPRYMVESAPELVNNPKGSDRGD